jgi:hypothetical protein
MSAFDPFFKRRYCNPKVGKIYFVLAQPFSCKRRPPGRMTRIESQLARSAREILLEMIPLMRTDFLPTG